MIGDPNECGAAGCVWAPGIRIPTAEPMCVVEAEQDMCLPPILDGADPACLVGIPGCSEPGGDNPGPFAPAWINHPDGGWVVVETCGWFPFKGFTNCQSGAGDFQPACDCACST